MPRSNLFNDLIRNIDPAWKELRKHPHKETRAYDDISIASYLGNEENSLKVLKNRLRSGSFSFSPLKQVEINGGKRKILIATVDDRIVAKALLKTIIPFFKKSITASNYCPISKTITSKTTGGIVGVPRAAKDMQIAFGAGYRYVFETDIIGFFNNIKKKGLFKVIKKYIKSKKILGLIEGILQFEVWNCSAEEYTDETIGVAQGSALSPLFAAIYLHDFDKTIETLGDVKLIRYVDDLVILCKTANRANEMHTLAEKELKKLGLSIHPLDQEVKGRIKTAIRDIHKQSLTFLGLKFINPTEITISDKKVEEKIEDVKHILRSSKPLLIKLLRIRNQLNGFIQQYQQNHYNAKGRLNTLIRNTQKEIGHYYHQAHSHILKCPPFREGTTNAQKEKFNKFLGLDLSDLLIE